MNWRIHRSVSTPSMVPLPHAASPASICGTTCSFSARLGETCAEPVCRLANVIAESAAMAIPHPLTSVKASVIFGTSASVLANSD